jgi:glucose/arabinose dehydrogenase
MSLLIRALVLLSAMAALGACSRSGGPPAPAGGYGLQTVATGLAFPLYLTAPPGDGARLFVVEKGGKIRAIKNGALLAAPFLDLTGQVSTGGEQGLLGLAFDPQYAANGRFYVNYTDSAGDTVVARYRVSSDPDRADPSVDRVLLTVDQPYANHNGGHLAFGPDGMLYIGLGDGGSGGDPHGHGQSRADLLGSLLRIDVRPAGAYAIPPDNPFVGQPGARPELWDYGLRNPWRFSHDRANGDLYIADVGQNRREEVNVAPAASGGGKGLNYGWNVMEGTQCFSPASGCHSAGLTPPALDYGHGGGACSVTGGYVYRGAALPALQGVYFYADYCAGWVKSFRYAAGQATELADWPQLAPGGNITSFGEDAAGELYVLTQQGGVYRVAAAP